MRFKLTLNVDAQKYGNAIPINYQYEQSALIYKILGSVNDQYTAWLHNNGYELNGKQFKLFTYSRLTVPQYRIHKADERLIIMSDKIEWYISFLPEQSTEAFIKGLFLNRSFQLGDTKSKVEFTVQQIEVVPAPEFTKDTLFETLSPICIARREEDGRTTYLSPADADAKEAIYVSLKNRFEAFYGKPYLGSEEFFFEVVGEAKSVLVKIKSNTVQETRVRGFMCAFKMCGDKELMKVADSGLGVKTSQGFGMVDAIRSGAKICH